MSDSELIQSTGSARLDRLRSWVAWRVQYEKHPSWTNKEQIKMAKACCALEEKVELMENRVKDFRAWVEASDCPLDVEQTLITFDECFPSQNK